MGPALAPLLLSYGRKECRPMNKQTSKSAEQAPATWACQIMLTGPAPTEEARETVALQWLEIVLDSGGTTSRRSHGSSIAHWRGTDPGAGNPPRALPAAWAMRETVQKMNES